MDDPLQKQLSMGTGYDVPGYVNTALKGLKARKDELHGPPVVALTKSLNRLDHVMTCHDILSNVTIENLFMISG